MANFAAPIRGGEIEQDHRWTDEPHAPVENPGHEPNPDSGRPAGFLRERKAPQNQERGNQDDDGQGCPDWRDGQAGEQPRKIDRHDIAASSTIAPNPDASASFRRGA